MCSYEVDDTLKKNINKQSKRQSEAILIEKNEVELNIYKSEIAVLKNKLSELEDKLLVKDAMLEEKENKIKELVSYIEKNNNNTVRVSSKSI